MRISFLPFSPFMALVVRREEEIKNFHPVKYFTVEALLHHEMGNIPAVWQIPADTEGVDSEGRLVERSVADTLLRKLQDAPKGTRGKILSVEEKKQQEGQRLPYSLSALQIEAGKRYGYSPQTVLDTMQSLYEKKHTTYPRSDCDYLPENQFDEAGQVLASVRAIHGKIFPEWRSKRIHPSVAGHGTIKKYLPIMPLFPPGLHRISVHCLIVSKISTVWWHRHI